MIRRWRKRRADSGQAPEVESLMRELNKALKRDFDHRRAREIHGMPASESDYDAAADHDDCDR